MWLTHVTLRAHVTYNLHSRLNAESIKAMKTPYGLQIIENCLTCPLHKDRLFCNLAPSILAELDAISAAAIYPKGAILFVEGQEPRGVFVVCSEPGPARAPAPSDQATKPNSQNGNFS